MNRVLTLGSPSGDGSRARLTPLGSASLVLVTLLGAACTEVRAPSVARERLDGGLADATEQPAGEDAGLHADAAEGFADATSWDAVAPEDAGRGGPSILSLAANTQSMTEVDQLVITALVTDPDGASDLLGGTLVDPGSARVYGAFIAAGSAGSYQITLGWSAIDTTSPIDAPSGSTTRTFRARFLDASGHAAEGELSVELHCAVAGRAACGGACVDLSTDRGNCGACGNTVPSDLTCRGGMPACPVAGNGLCGGQCFDLRTTEAHCGSCDHACPSFSGATVSCTAGGCHALASAYTRVTCSSVCAAAGWVCTGATFFFNDGQYPIEESAGCNETPVDPSNSPERWYATDCECVDRACAQGPENTVAACSDGCSNDGDRFIDCEDYDCCRVVSCPSGTACNP